MSIVTLWVANFTQFISSLAHITEVTVVYLPPIVIALRNGCFVCIPPVKQRRWFFGAEGVALGLLFWSAEALVIRTLRNHGAFFVLLTMAGCVIGAALQDGYEVIVDGRAAKKFRSETLFADYTFLARGRNWSMYVMSAATTYIWLKLTPHTLQKLASKVHIPLPWSANIVAFHTLHLILELESLAMVAGAWIVSSRFQKFRSQRWRHVRSPFPKSINPVEAEVLAVDRALSWATTEIARALNPIIIRLRSKLTRSRGEKTEENFSD